MAATNHAPSLRVETEPDQKRQEAQVEMNEQSVVTVSPDGNFYWDGAQWQPALSPDGAWRWDGAACAPVPPNGFGAPTPYTSAADIGLAVRILLGITAAV